MTARVLNPIALTEFCKMRSPASLSIGRNLPCGRQVNQIKRNLFGTANPVETKKVFKDEVEQHQEKASKKWGFDFRTGNPLAIGNTQYIWERVQFVDVLPEMYTLTRAAHVREVPNATSFDHLMDERADRENSSLSALETDSCDDSQDESMSVFKAPTASAAPSTVAASCRTLRKRQPKITEYMKERKRLAQTPKKISPAKRARTTSSSSTNSLLNSLRSLQRNN